MSRNEKGMSPKHVRKSHVTRSSGTIDPIFCMTTLAKYDSMSPKSQKVVRDDTRLKLSKLEAKAAQRETASKRRLFASQPGSSPAHTTCGSPNKKKKNNNKGQTVAPNSPDCGLPGCHPKRDGTRSSLRIHAFSPEKALSMKAEPID